MAGTGKAYEGKAFHPPPLPEGTDTETVHRWRYVEDYLSLRVRVVAKITDDDTNYVSGPVTDQEVIWDAVDEDTSSIWNGSSRFIITKETAGDYIFSLDSSFASGSLTATYGVNITVDGHLLPFAIDSIYKGSGIGTLTSWVTLRDGDEVYVAFSCDDSALSTYMSPGSGTELRILRLI